MSSLFIAWNSNLWKTLLLFWKNKLRIAYFTPKRQIRTFHDIENLRIAKKLFMSSIIKNYALA